MSDSTAKCVTDDCERPRAKRNNRCWSCINKARKPRVENRTCSVVFSNGSDCVRPWKYRSGLCDVCYNWSRKNGGAEPNGRDPHVTAVKGVLCPVVFSNGTPCARQSTLPTGFCEKCARWSRTNGDPQGRPFVRGNGSVLKELERAASATTGECILLPLNGDSRPTAQLDGRWMNASRAVWILANGDPGALFVLHTCNGGSGSNGCINVRHLILGPQAENMHHASLINSGEVNGSRGLLSPGDVADIKSRYVKGARFPHPGSSRALAAEFGIKPQYVHAACRGELWSWVASK